MSKERLEKAKLMAEMLRVETRLPHDFPFDLVDWLVEQAEQKQSLETAVDFYQSALRDADRRVQELEELLTQIKYDKEAHIALSEKYLKKQLQNKRYREYLELIKTTGTYGKDISTGEILRTYEANLADEALEGEE